MSIFYSEPELVIGIDKKVIFVNPNDLQIFKEIDLPTDLKKYSAIVGEPVAANDTGDTPSKTSVSGTSSSENHTHLTLQNVCLAPNKRLLAITTGAEGGQKAVLLFECRPEHGKLISVRSLARASNGLVFRSDSLSLLVTDKSGDCYEYDCVNVEAAPRHLLGHLSIVYDVWWTPDTKYIITCDRDDKIRVTNYPNTYDIHGYCLGHKEFVAGLAQFDDDIICSVSGDKTLRLWNFHDSNELLKVDLPAPAIKLKTRKLSNNHNDHHFQAVILYHNADECVGVYDVKKVSAETEKDAWIVTLHGAFSTDLDVACNICFTENRLYVIGLIGNHFGIRTLEMEGSTPEPEHWRTMLEEQFKESELKLEEVSTWFKKHYDNVTDYLERKKRRIEEKKK